MAAKDFKLSMEEVGYRLAVLAVAKVASLGMMASLEAIQVKNLH
jgi:hypothetical protein